jgi:MOSC domain-containing protein YiiM
VSVNVGRPRTVEWFGRQVTSAIWKSPVEGPVAIRGNNLDGDEQADHRVHGGYDKGVYAYALEDYEWWSAQLGQPFEPGTFGENLTTEGIDLASAIVGERWQVGSAVLEVSEPRSPCFKLGIRMGDSAFVDLFEQASRFGTYLRIVAEGTVTRGDGITRGEGRRDGVTVGDLISADHDPTPALLARIAAAPEVPERWRATADRALARQAGPQPGSQARLAP